MRVTVITPSKNQGEFFEHCLRSVHGQTHSDIEHLVFDGMSTDSSAEVAAKFPCKFFQSKDSGPAQAINRGLDMATGDICCWLNADDTLWSSKTLERVVRLFEELPEVDVITGNGYYIYEDGGFRTPIVMERATRVSLLWIKRFDYLLQPATFWRRNSFRLDETLHYCFDWKLWIEFFQAGLNVLYAPEYFAQYRIHSKSLTQQDTAARKREILDMAKQYDGRRTQVALCWLVWKAYELGEALGSDRIKRIVGRANTRVGTLSGGRFGSQ